jgi:5-formyltetrahydrofolate cyclo-ligase
LLREFGYILRTGTMHHEDINEAKAQTRRAVGDVLSHLTPGRRRAASVALAEKLAQMPELRAAGTLMLFLSLPSEIDTWPIIRWAWREGKRVVVPRIESSAPGREKMEDRGMTPVLLAAANIRTIHDHPGVRPGPLGILDVPDGPEVPVAEIDVVLVPCLAVDREGNRLGRGGGFYDRFLARPDLKARTIVIALQEQLFDEVPVNDRDRRAAGVVTDAETVVLAVKPR